MKRPEFIERSLKSGFELDADELLWLAEAILGNRLEAESCVIEVLSLAVGEVYVAAASRDLWMKRCVVQAAVRRARTEIREIARSYPRHGSFTMSALPLNAADRQILRSFPAERITEGSNVLECATLILHGYLGFSIHNCAVSMECDRSLIEPACACALRKLFDHGTDAFRNRQDVEPTSFLGEVA